LGVGAQIGAVILPAGASWFAYQKDDQVALWVSLAGTACAFFGLVGSLRSSAALNRQLSDHRAEIGRLKSDHEITSSIALSTAERMDATSPQL
jgi:hypothetical protein